MSERLVSLLTIDTSCAAPEAADPLAPLRQRAEVLCRRLNPAYAPHRVRVLGWLERFESPAATWVLLAWLDRGDPRACEGPARLAALMRLLASEDRALRCAAHRGLATLHRIDLRCEQRAKRALRSALDSNDALERRRVAFLLRRC